MAFPGELNINYYKGDTHEFKVYPQKTDGSIFYLDDYSNATFTIATERGADPTTRIIGSAIISTDGTHITCAITPENGAAMDASITYEYDIQVYAQGPGTYDKIFTLLTGSISVTDDVSQGIGLPNSYIPTYRVIYHSTDATGGTAPVDETLYVKNQNINILGSLAPQTLSRIGYDFSGWTKTVDGSGELYAPGSVHPLSASDINFYPKWTINTISYDDQSATTTYSGGSIKYSTGMAIATIPTTSPIRIDHVFSGWFTGPAGSGVEVTDGSYTPPSPYGPITIYAKWINNKIIYDDQSATTTYSGGSTHFVIGEAIEFIPTVDPIRTGYVFGGWFTGPAGSGVQVTDGSYTPESPYGPITIYAKWTEE